MRLAFIYKGDFRKSEVNLYKEAIKFAAKDGHTLTLNDEDCILLISGTGKMLRFVYGYRSMEVIGSATRQKTGNRTKIMISEVLRIDGAGTWNPLMLANYAEAVGIELEGIKRFETYYKHLTSKPVEKKPIEKKVAGGRK